jgi:hypothetical protein
MKTQFLLSLTLVLATFHAEAATITPAMPTAQDVITAVIDVNGLITYDRPFTSVIGNTIRTNLPVIGTVNGPPAFTSHEFVSFGPLPAATYTYEVYDVVGGQSFLHSQQTIVVAPAIPTMNRSLLSILAVSLTAIACFAIGKRT